MLENLSPDVGKLVCPAVAVKTSLFIVACGVGIVPI
jgi:hypothetical protein